jgi:hypothetical protein
MAQNLSDEMLDQLAGEAASKSLIERAIKPSSGGGFINQFVKPAVLPTVGGIAGAALGGGIGTPFGMTVPGGIAGGALGSMAGEAGNQALGITEPSLSQIGLAGAVPLAVGGVAAGLRTLAPFATSGRAAQVLNALAPEEAAGRVGAMLPKVPASSLFKQAAAAQVTIPMNRTLHMLDNMLDEMANVSSGLKRANSQAIGYIKGLKNLLQTNPNGLSPTALQRELEGVGKVVKSIKTKGGTGSGEIQQTFKAMVNDLDDAAKMANPGLPGAQTLIAARDAFKRESVVKELGEAITDATKNLRGQGDFVQFNANAVLKSIAKNPFYEKAFSATEKGEVESLLKLLNKIPALRPGAGAQFGSGIISQMLAGSAVGAGIGGLAGGREGAVTGAAAGFALGPIAAFGRNVSVALQMSTGRALMKELLTQSKGVATPQVASIIAAYARAVEANPQLGQ